MPNRQERRATPEQNRLLGRLIGAHRVLRGWEPAELGRLLGRSKAWVSRLEAGQVGLSALEYVRIADILRIPAAEMERIAWRGVPRPQLPPDE